MILCVTLNPCLDKTLSVPDWHPGENIRGVSAHELVGGKGNNVARALTRIGRVARPVTFFGGAIGAHCESLLRRDDGLDPIVTPIAASTRVILTVRAGATPATAFFDPDPAVTRIEAHDLLHRFEGALLAGGVDGVTLSGSSPSAETHELFSELIAICRARRVPAFLDTYGPPLDAIWGFWPQAIHINKREAALHLQVPQPSGVDLLHLLRRWASRGVQTAVVTDGPHPIVALVDGAAYRVIPPTIAAVNPIGSGDSFLAGLVDARLRGDNAETTLRHAVGCAVANAEVWDAGAIDPTAVASAADRVVLEPF